MVVEHALAAGQFHAARATVDHGHAALHALHALLVEPLRRAEAQGRGADLAEQVSLGQRRALVGHAGLIADQGDMASKAFLAQRSRYLIAGLAGADDNHVVQ